MIALQFFSQPEVICTSWVEILTVSVLISLAVTAFRHFNCHVNSPHFCWRFGHPVEGTHYRACTKHHPKRPAKITAAHIARAREEARPPGAAP